MMAIIQAETGCYLLCKAVLLILKHYEIVHFAIIPYT
jgi:hypothetical protein